MALKRIGIFDHRLDNFHAEVYLKALRGPLAARGYEIAGATALAPEVSRQWAEDRNVPYYDTIEALGGEVDYLMVLAPSRPDLHLEMCRDAFRLGVPTFVDKTFAPDEATAREIFALADRANVAVQTTSALRTTAVQRRLQSAATPALSLIVFSSGSSFAEYGVHPVELAVSCMGYEVEALLRLGPPNHPQWLLRFSGGRTALIDFHAGVDAPFAAVISTDRGHEHVEINGQELFIDAASSILDFFDAGRPLVDRRETLIIRRILDRAMHPAAENRFLTLGDLLMKQEPAPPHFSRAAVTT